MCGLAGFIDFNKRSSQQMLDAMVSTLQHRGPDDKGSEMVRFDNCVVGLGHTRLSIIDLSDKGRQPIRYGHFTLVFNGEVYNYIEIKSALEAEGHLFVTQTDTEVVVHALQHWGLKALGRFNGMFAFVLLDHKEECIHIVRDRAGIKPLYYYWKDGLFLFASELKAFHAHSGFEKHLNIKALKTFFDIGYIPAPRSIFKYTKKLVAGRFLTMDLESRAISSQSYWRIRDYYNAPEKKISYQDAKEEVGHLLSSACEYRMVADVPVGVFLSGGFDSTTMAAILQKDRTEKLRTFSIGFEDGSNEVAVARQTAAYLGTNHVDQVCTASDAQNIFDLLPFHYDEPLGDCAVISNMLVSKLAAGRVKVVLSGDGGDELFAGYGKHALILRYASLLKKVPSFLAPVGRSFLKQWSFLLPDYFQELKHKASSISTAWHPDKHQQIGTLFSLASCLPSFFSERMYAPRVKAEISSNGIPIDNYHQRDELSVMLSIDFEQFLEGALLAKVDRSSMSVSIEGRHPYLDFELVSFVSALPSKYKFDGNQQKKILKEVLADYVPPSTMGLSKRGFGAPIKEWLKGDLAHYLDYHLSDAALLQSQLFNVPFLRKQIALFKTGRLYYDLLVWRLLVFQMWYARWMG